MTHDELLAIALTRVRPETAARAAAARALNDIELSSLVLKAAEVDVVVELASEVGERHAALDARERAIDARERAIEEGERLLDEYAKSLGVSP